MTRTDSTSRGEWTVQLLVQGERDAALLAEWLPPEWDLVDGDGVAARTDLLLADRPGLERHVEAIADAKRGARPEFLPVVALIRGGSDGSPLSGIGVPADLVDDVVAMPVGKWELRKRVESQLRTRELSLELASREAQYRGLVELLPEAIVVVQAGVVRYANDAGRRLLLGGDAEEGALVDREVTSFVTDGDRAVVESLLATIAETGSVDEYTEVTVEDARGDVHECEVSGVRVSYREEEATQLIVRDVTERNRQRREIELFRRALDDANQGVTVADARREDLPLIYANAAFERITGYSVPEIIGRNCRFLQGEDTDPETVAEIRHALAERRPVTVEILNYRKDGTPFYNELEITPVRNDAGEVTHFIGFQTDVTERVEREQRLAEFGAVLQAAGDPIVAVDGAGEVTTVNEAFTDFLGAPESAVLGEPIESVLGTDGPLVDAVARAAADRAPRRLDARIDDEDGEPRYCDVTVAPREDGDGAVAVIRDVTGDRRRRQRVAVLDRLLRHNLRNKMNVVLGRAETVLHGDGEVAPNLEAIVGASEELLAMVEDVRRTHELLDENEPDRPLALVDLVERHLEGVSAAYPAVTVDCNLADLTVSARPSVGVGIDQVIENAFEHNTGDEQTVEVTIEREGEWARLVVSDDGPGIPAEELAVLTASEETPLEHSQGVGIWLARWAVENSGGELDVTVDDGTTVTIRLPLAPEASG